jgi:hypothetical protein
MSCALFCIGLKTMKLGTEKVQVSIRGEEFARHDGGWWQISASDVLRTPLDLAESEKNSDL